jgi:hypothetical protein
LGGKVYIQNIRKSFNEKIVDDKAELGGSEIAFQEFGITLVSDGFHNRIINTFVG